MTYLMQKARMMVRQLELIADVVLTSLAFLAAFAVKENLLMAPYGGLLETPNYYLIMLMTTVIWYVTLDIVKVDYSYASKISGPRLMGLLKGVTICTTILVLCMYLFKITEISRLLIIIFYVFDLTFLLLARVIVRQLTPSIRKESSRHHILILGSHKTAQDLIQIIVSHVGSDINIIGCIETTPEDVGKTVACGIQVIGTLDDLREILLNQIVDEVLITMPLNDIDNSEWYLSFISTFGIGVRIIPDWYIRKFMTIHPAHSFEVELFLSEPALSLTSFQGKHDTLVIKAVMDYILAVFALIITSPLFLIIPGLIKMFSSGPAFYKQVRCGQYGRKFQVYKFRTMVLGAEEKQSSLAEFNEASGPTFKIKKDPRIIPYIGTFLRRSGLDELPQFINVIRSEMSIVGPRPPLPSEVEQYELWQRRRLSMKPGITCIWQIQSKRNEIPFEKWIDMDMDYIDHWSLWLDIVLIVKTIPAILFGRGR